MGKHQKLSSLTPVPGAKHLGTQALDKQLFCCAKPPKISMAGLALVIPYQTTVFLFAGPKAHTGTHPHPSSESMWHTHTHSCWLDIHLVITDVAWYLCLNLHSNST